MGRIIGLIGCTCLVIAAMRLTNLTHVETTKVKGSDDLASTKENLTPRQHYKRGREFFLRGRYFDAISHLEEAAAASTGLTDVERRQNEDFLNRARAKVQGVADGKDPKGKQSKNLTFRGQSDPWGEETESNSSAMDDAVRDRVDQMMIQAKAAYKKGNEAEAIKLAELANKLARSAHLKFGKDEVSPIQFLTKITSGKQQTAEKSNAKADWDATTGDSNSEWVNSDRKAERSNTIKQASNRESNRDQIQLASDEDSVEQPVRTSKAGSDSTQSHQPNALKERATMLIAQCREDIQAGRFEDAKRHALEADELGVSYGVFEDRPELLLADIDRRMNTTTLARNSGPASSKAAATNNGQSNSSSTQQVANSSDSEAERKRRAVQLMDQARKALKEGDLDTAQAKSEQAQQLNVAFKLFDDMPETILNDVENRRSMENVASKTRNGGETPSAEEIQQAKGMLLKARRALNDGRIEEARDLATKVGRMKVAFGLLDDTPEMVLNEIARMEGKKPTRSSATSAGDPGSATDMQMARAEAVKLLRQARQMMKEGRFDEARSVAVQVQEMEVALPVTADSPDLLLSDIGKAEMNIASRSGSGSSPVKTANNTESASESDNPFVPGKGRKGKLVGASDTRVVEANETTEFSQSGLSASELYNRGMSELKRGNRDMAYQAFKAAHETGQRLDPVRTQRMNDYLRDLSPRSNRSGIQLTNNEENIYTGSTPLDSAQQEQIVKFERIRADVMNAVFKAERLKDSDPEKALELIDQTLAKVESAELSTEAAAPLLKQLNRTRSGLRSEIEQQAPNLALKAENKRVKERINKEVENAIRIDQDMVKLVDEYNDLYKQQRYAEAEVVAKKAKELNPKDPTVVMMVLKAQFARQNKFIEDLKENKEKTRLDTINDIEKGLVHKLTDDHPMDYDPEVWKRANGRPGKYGLNNRVKTEDETRIEESLQKRISLHEENVPLIEVIRKIKAIADINIVLDEGGLEDVGVSSNTAVSIDVNSITVKSALNLILNRFDLGYMVDNEVLKITNRVRQQGNLQVVTYSVADLVIPIPNFGSTSGDTTINMSPQPPTRRGFGPAAYMGGPENQVFAQIGPGMGGGMGGPAAGGGGPRSDAGEWKPTQSNRNTDFGPLTELITSTIAPESWQEAGGEATLKHYDTTLSLVVRQTQRVHEEIADLLAQLRRLQDLQVTIEVRFVTVSDRFFERIGIDFNFDIKPTTGFAKYDNNLLPIPNFGQVLIPQSGINTTSGTTGTTGTTGGTSSGGQVGQTGGQQSQTGGQQSQTGQTTSSGLFNVGPTQSLYNNPSNTTIVGLSSPNQFTQDLTIPFQQGSFNVGIPTFGGYNPAAGVQTGIAILSDLEAFFFIQAAQGDQRTNLLFSPKVTLFNGQSATVSDTRSRPFVTSLVPTVGFGAVGYTPVITNVPEGITLTATAVISADRRYVRLTLLPFFRSITDVFTFQATGSGSGGQQGQGQGQGGFGGGQFGGGGGGGQAGGGAGGGGGQFGIGGGLGSMQIMQALFSQQVGGVGGGGGGIGGGQVGGGGQQGQNSQQGGGTSITVQQPVIETINVSTTVSVPDGGTVLMGGIKRLKEGRTMAGVPILNKIPYVSRLFKNSGVGRETESLMLMVTPRILIQEEEEELLGLPRY